MKTISRTKAIVPLTLYTLATILAVSAASPDSIGLSDLSTKCGAGLTSILASSFASCANLQGMLSIITTRSDQSLVPPLDKYIKGMKICSDSDLAIVKSTLSTACNDAKDQNSPTVLAIGQIANNYNDIRALLTIKEDGSSKYCVTNLLSSAESSSHKKFTPDNLENLLSGNAKPMLSFLDKLDTSVYCNKCGQAVSSRAYTLAQNTPESAGSASDIKAAVDSKCGTGFTSSNGTLPQGTSADGTGGAVSGGFNSWLSLSSALLVVALSFSVL